MRETLSFVIKGVLHDNPIRKRAEGAPTIAARGARCVSSAPQSKDSHDMFHRRWRGPILAMTFGLCATVLPGGAAARSHGDPSHSAGRFDYYLMSLSWSPSYCLTHPGETDQCGSKGFGFVLHGLWPQYRNGTWPQHCGTHVAPDMATIERTLAFMPSRYLIEHEWQTHGTCTGMDPKAYFGVADRVFASLKIPDALKAPRSPPALSAGEVVQAFARANPGLDGSMLSVVCHDGGQLAEVRVCLGKESLAPQACGGRVRNSCRYGKLTIPAIR
jgi:ribonuclease T2